MEDDKREQFVKRMTEQLAFVLPESVTITPSFDMGDLVMAVRWPRPLPGRPNAHAVLHVVLVRETIDDCFDADNAEHISDRVDARFRSFIQGKMAHYQPEPDPQGGSGKPEVWKVAPKDLCVGFGD